MSVADRLGTGSSFSEARRTRSARGRAKAMTQGDVPAYELVRLRLDEVSPTPLNPRRNFGTDEDKTRFGEELRQAQLAACVAVSRTAYLALWPDHAERIGEVAHVLVNGERRFRSAVHVGMDALDFVVRDDLASSREAFINHLLQENLEREDFDVIERARGVRSLVIVCGEQSERGARARAAERLGKDRSWVTNQLSLLELPDELQAMLSSGDLPERDGRLLARHCKENPDLDAAGLLGYLKDVKDLAARKRAKEAAAVQAVRATNGTRPDDGLLSADNNQDTSQEDPTDEDESAGLLSVDNKPEVEDTPPTAPSETLGEDSKDASAEPLLSADNKPDGKASRAPSHTLPAQQAGVAPVAPSIVPRSPRQIAGELAEQLTHEQLAELTELLIERVSTKTTTA
ncbi:ParB/RepB/Spo0J family partition protein [Streptomyces sp. NBC_01455]|uniref:ParB/RepB/Spo0J family partition protein n=1 Tax=Streptomyces sp. NBC_01455 TaxID=2903874 RepID=UPI002E30C259|nr:plasmid partitioning protein [Streptomyces sp. NBC_01455]